MIGVANIVLISASTLRMCDTQEVEQQEVESFDLGSEDLTLESLEAKSFVLTFEDLSLLSQETKSLDTELESPSYGKPMKKSLPFHFYRVSGSIRIHIEQRIAAMMGYRGGRLEGDEEKLYDEYEGLWRLGIIGYRHYLLVVSSSWSSAVLGTISSIPINGSISPEGLLLPILLLVVIIVTVVIVMVILIVVVDDVSLILKLSIPIVGVPVGFTSTCIVAACASRAVGIPLAISCWMAAKVMVGVSDVDFLLGALRGYGMIHNDEDGDNDANDRDDDEREISWK
ncbi:hypothetical protein Tco_1491981 [Tanacetum coccineum]